MHVFVYIVFSMTSAFAVQQRTFKHQLLRMQIMLGSLYKVHRAAVESTHTHTHKIMLIMLP